MTIYTLFLYIGIVAIGLTLILGVGHAKLMKYARMRPILWFLQYFVGSLLIFSGLVKVVDPLGTAYKMADYFTLLLPMLSFMKPYALPFALVMIVLEVVLGINLILGHGKRWTTGLTFLMMLFFTFLTGYNYLTGFLPEGVGIFQFGQWSAFKETNIRVTDCGCFGDFLKLLPIETFLKDVLLTGITIYLMVKTNDLKFLVASDKKIGKMSIRGILTLLFTIATIVICFLNFYFGLPWVDFRPFQEGKNITIARAECDLDAPKTVYTYTYVNKDNNKMEVVTSDQITTEFEKYKYLYDKNANGEKIWNIDTAKTKENVLNKGCDSKVKEMDGSKQHTFATHGFTFLVVADDLSHSSKAGFKKIGEIAKAAKTDGVETHGMYYHIPDGNGDNDDKAELKSFIVENMGIDVDFTQSDEKLVKTIIRSSPGLLLLHNGTIVKKWHHRTVPAYDYIKMTYMQKQEPELVLKLQIEDYSPDATVHTFMCTVLNKVKGSYEGDVELRVLDGNDALLKELTSDTTETGATLAPIEVSFIKRSDLASKNEKINWIPNGMMDKQRNAWQIIEIKK